MPCRRPAQRAHSCSASRFSSYSRPAGTNALEAKTTVKIAPGSKGKVAVTFADKSTANIDVVID